MRLPLIPPSSLDGEKRALYEDMKKGIETSFKGFKAMTPDGTLIGPWNPWLHYTKFGAPVWELVKALSTSPKLPREVREVAILTTGARFKAGYALYAHILLAEMRGLSDEKIVTIAAGQRPSDLTKQEACAFDLTYALASGATLPELCYRQAVNEFGEDGAAELIYLVGLYCMVCTTLNGFDVAVPED